MLEKNEWEESLDKLFNGSTQEDNVEESETIIRVRPGFQEQLESEAKEQRLQSESAKAEQESEEPILQNTGAWETERLGAGEKRPVHITQKGRLPLSISIETAGGGVFRIAEIGDVLPVRCTQEFTANEEGAVWIRLYAGERPLAKQNRLIKKTKLRSVRKFSNGRPAITVEFCIEADGTIRIEAIDEGSLCECAEEIGKSWKPSEDEIFAIVQEARDHLQEDEKIWERIRLMQRAREGMLRAAEALKTEKASPAQKKDVRKSLKSLERILKKKSVAELTAQEEELMGKFI